MLNKIVGKYMNNLSIYYNEVSEYCWSKNVIILLGPLLKKMFALIIIFITSTICH